MNWSHEDFCVGEMMIMRASHCVVLAPSASSTATKNDDMKGPAHFPIVCSEYPSFLFLRCSFPAKIIQIIARRPSTHIMELLASSLRSNRHILGRYFELVT